MTTESRSRITNDFSPGTDPPSAGGSVLVVRVGAARTGAVAHALSGAIIRLSLALSTAIARFNREGAEEKPPQCGCTAGALWSERRREGRYAGASIEGRSDSVV